jgi:NitT/TauT family transport system permease protein
MRGETVKSRGKTAGRIAAALLALLVWQAAAALVGNGLLLPGPWQVLGRLVPLAGEADFWATVLFSFSRITLGFFLAFVLSAAASAAAARFGIVETLLRPYIVTVKAVPVASFIILLFLWFSGRQLPTLISFLMVFPVLYANLLEGLKATSPELLQMAKVYRLGFGRRLKWLYLPQLRSYLVSGCSAGVGFAWKAGVAAEVIGVVSGSIGGKLYEAKIYFLTADLLAWTLVIIVCSAVFEKLVRELIELGYRGLYRR